MPRRPVETGQAALGHGCRVPVDVGDAPMSLPVDVADKSLQPAGSRIGSVAQLLGSLEYTLFRRFSDISPSVERIAVPGLTYA